nr:MAG TPA: CIII protein family protein [Caudoviricetes sp.]
MLLGSQGVKKVTSSALGQSQDLKQNPNIIGRAFHIYQLINDPLRRVFIAYQNALTRVFRYANTHQRKLPMMQYSLAGSGVMSAYYPPESELHRKVRQLIHAAMNQWRSLCK